MDLAKSNRNDGRRISVQDCNFLMLTQKYKNYQEIVFEDLERSKNCLDNELYDNSTSQSLESANQINSRGSHHNLANSCRAIKI